MSKIPWQDVQSHLKNTDVIIAPFAFHTFYLNLKQASWAYRFQLMTKDQFLSDVTFEFEHHRAMAKVVESFGMSYHEASTLLTTLKHFPFDQLTNQGPYQPLYRVYQLLIQNKMIQTNPFSYYKYQGKRILIDGYLSDDKMLLQHLEAKGSWVDFIEIDKIQPPCEVHVYSNLEDEVSGFLNQVAHLLKQGKNLSSMVLIDPGVAYYYELKRQSQYFQIPIQLPTQETIFSLPLIQVIVHELESGMDVNTLLTKPNLTTHPDWAMALPFLKEYQGLTLSPAGQLDYIRHRFQQTRLKEPRYRQAIQVVKEHAPSESDEVFVLGFVQGSYPSTTRDKGYLSDSEKTKLGMLTSSQEQAIQTQRFSSLLSRSTHRYLSYCRILEGKVMIPSPWINPWKMQVVERSHVVEGVDYSQNLGMMRKVKYEHIAKQFKEVNPYLKAYQQAFPKITSLFDNAYTPIDANAKNKPLRLSYSALKDYYACSFKYFIGRVLKVKPMDQDEFYMHLGTFAHEVFETMGTDLSQFDKVFDQALKNQKSLSAKETMLFSHLKRQLLRVCEFNLNHFQAMANPTMEVEKEMVYQHDANTSLVGYIDKIMMVRDEQGQEYLTVVDYKSGAETFDEQLLPFGWSLQLPIYALMLQEHPSFQGKEVLGLFIQHIIETSLNPKTIEIEGKLYPKSLQLDGIAVADQSKLQWFDETILNGQSQFLQGVSIVKSGEFRKTNHVKSKETIASYATLAKQKIEQASQGIRQQAYAINPKIIKGKSSCDYCPFLDTCFRKPSDVESIEMEKKGWVDTDGDTN
jgi:ATP-dependent helicase/DNAse subunit B